MKYARNAKVFRGQLDTASIACVFFTLLILILFHSSLVYTPGVRVELAELSEVHSPRSGKKELLIAQDQTFTFDNSKFKETEFYQRLRELSKKGKAPRILIARAATGLESEVLSRLDNVADELKISVQKPISGLELPEVGEFAGTDKASVVLAIAHNRQYYFQNQMVRKEDIRKHLEAAKLQSKEPLILILEIDRDIPHENVLQVCALARAAGITEVNYAVRPQLRPAPPSSTPIP